MVPGGPPNSCASATHRRFDESQFAPQPTASSSSVGVRIPRLSRSSNRLGYPPARERIYQEGCPSGEPKPLKHKEHGSRSCRAPVRPWSSSAHPRAAPPRHRSLDKATGSAGRLASAKYAVLNPRQNVFCFLIASIIPCCFERCAPSEL